jgi:hypothetical protein
MFENFVSYFKGGSLGEEIRETERLYARAKQLRGQSPFRDDESANAFVLDLINSVQEDLDIVLTSSLMMVMRLVVISVMWEDQFILNFPSEGDNQNLANEVRHASAAEAKNVRDMLARYVWLQENKGKHLETMKARLYIFFAGLIDKLPLSVLSDLDDDGALEDQERFLPEARIFDLFDNLPDMLDRTLGSMLARELEESDLFTPLRIKLLLKIDLASNIPLEERYTTKKERVPPTEYRDSSPETLVSTYLGNTSIERFFTAYVPYAIPFAARFEHTHILAGTGHGKTQTLQFMILADLYKAAKDGRSVIVIDSQGDLIRNISRLEMFASHGALEDRIVIIDPTDVEHPAAFNMFDFNRGAMDSAGIQERELLLNASVEAYEYFFGHLLGAELTQKQGMLFRFLARLLVEIPEATIHTLRDLMENGERYRMYMERLPHTPRGFFETRFFDRSMAETKKQILARLWGVLSNATLERMFSHSMNMINFGELMQEGKIILVNTAKGFLGAESSRLFGRFIVTMLTQATLQRGIIPKHMRNPSFVYIDEAQDYVDVNIGRLCVEARKQMVGLIFAHQNLDQLPPDLRSIVLSCTTIKYAGGISSKDANVLDGDFRVPADFLLSQRKDKYHTEFACFVKNETKKAISIRVPLGVMEGEEEMDDDSFQLMTEINQILYTAPAEYPTYEELRNARTREAKKLTFTEPTENVDEAPKAETVVRDDTVRSLALPDVYMTPVKPKVIVPPVARNPTGGGQKHRYLQEFVKTLGEERGFRAQIEQGLPDGSGRVDVILSKGDRKIACEISVTTSRDHELQNVEKCLAAGFDEVLLISQNERHLKSLTTFVGNALAESDRPKVRFLHPDMIVGYLGQDHAPMETEQIVRGYKVKVVGGNDADATLRKAAIAEVMARVVGGG